MEKQAENFMKMFLSVAKDLRVIIIKFADRLHNMSTIEHLPLIKQRRIAIETRDVYAPLAHRLGMNRLKTELEDMVLKTLEPDEYQTLHKKIRSTRKQREKYIEEFSNPINSELHSFNIQATIKGRAKHYYSIHGKMIKRNKSFEDIYDIMAVRIITSQKKDCYTALGIIHEVYTPIHERFKDFIASPKGNGYQSLHTTVFGMNGRMVEVQLRTEDMDRTAEIGVAAHWAYKENKTNGGKDTAAIDPHIEWLRELVEVLQSEDTCYCFDCEWDSGSCSEWNSGGNRTTKQAIMRDFQQMIYELSGSSGNAECIEYHLMDNGVIHLIIIDQDGYCQIIELTPAAPPPS